MSVGNEANDSGLSLAQYLHTCTPAQHNTVPRASADLLARPNVGSFCSASSQQRRFARFARLTISAKPVRTLRSLPSQCQSVSQLSIDSVCSSMSPVDLVREKRKVTMPEYIRQKNVSVANREVATEAVHDVSTARADNARLMKDKKETIRMELDGIE